jgi:outer membrane protein TolC
VRKLGRCLGALVLRCLGAAVLGGFSTAAYAQAPQPVERVTFREAIERAIARNPSSAIAAAGILRADALLAQARSASRLQINANATSTTLNRGIKFEDLTVTPQTSVTGSLDVRYPLYAPVVWARRIEAADSREIAAAGAEEAKRQTAFATADAYLTILARRRSVDAVVRARDAAKAHADLATELEQRGSGSRLNRLRAEQELSTDEGLIESARFGLYQAQEALGVLLVVDGPVDAADEPTFDLPPDASGGGPVRAEMRSDLRLFAAEQRAAERVLANNSKSYLPVFEGIFRPQSTYPSQFFVPANSWQLLVQMNVPLFDSGQRAAERRARQSSVDVARATLAGATTTIASEARTAREAVASAERELVSVRAAADQAQQVVEIVNISFRAGASTNIEVIDAERRARDADTTVAVAEDTLRRARFDLLNALGRFP